MSDIPEIPPQRARLALAQSLRGMADAVESGDIVWVGAVCLYTPEVAKAKDHAFAQCSGFPTCDPASFWITSLGIARSAFLDFEQELCDIGARTITKPRVYTS